MKESWITIRTTHSPAEATVVERTLEPMLLRCEQVGSKSLPSGMFPSTSRSKKDAPWKLFSSWHSSYAETERDDCESAFRQFRALCSLQARKACGIPRLKTFTGLEPGRPIGPFFPQRCP